VDLVGLHGSVPSGRKGGLCLDGGVCAFMIWGRCTWKACGYAPQADIKSWEDWAEARIEFVINEALGTLTKGGDGSSSLRGVPAYQLQHKMVNSWPNE
jgi:hypothetical protein